MAMAKVAKVIDVPVGTWQDRAGGGQDAGAL